MRRADREAAEARVTEEKAGCDAMRRKVKRNVMAAWVALESGETGHAWVVQPGRPPLDFRFPTLPGPRTASDEQVGMPPSLA